MRQQQVDQIEVLLHFNLDSTLQGIKIHHDARQGLVDAAKQLHELGLISNEDGGYLTELGHKAAEHLQQALRIMKPIN
ncbi:TIGR02647 family protein [Methylophaga sp. OBS3]|uniref:TIGR02647 family protein n=1 Tax=Methylophaga sp. OBS3 TaxID=2991934 RepID=UPI0022554496|nr:TIGR02647 family protein [Methylophaga sp. OBS3]MCX4189761.1 TIGR02647 family protein [Methylophaga sp. OBS3]